MIGSYIKEKYEVKALVAESHLYEIYTATEVETGTPVVIKMLSEECSRDEAKVKAFSDEVALYARLNHPLVAKVYDFDAIAGRPFLVSEPVEGRELRAWIKEGELSFFAAIAATRKLTELLGYAAEQGVSPRYLKQSNIVRTPEGNLRVLSFSLPRLKLVVSHEHETGSGIQSDAFFLGTILFELLSGESPTWKRGGLNELWDSRLRQSMRIRHPQLAPEEMEKVIALIERTFTREMKLRYRTHQEILTGLAELEKIAAKSEKAAKPAVKNFASAGEVVDAITGKSGARQMASGFSAVGANTGAGAVGTSAVAAAKSPSQPIAISARQKGAATGSGKGAAQGAGKGAVLETVGNVALAADLETNPVAAAQAAEEPAQFGRPILHLIKGGRDAARSVIWKYSDEQAWHKNPFILIGSAILIMLLIIFFW
jgi:hypothetical protein